MDTFNWVHYLNNYSDLRAAGIKDQKSAYIHYLKYGFIEKRIYKFPDDFDHNIYQKIYSDLENLNEEELKEHYLIY
jgi:hypothetical protein